MAGPAGRRDHHGDAVPVADRPASARRGRHGVGRPSALHPARDVPDRPFGQAGVVHHEPAGAGSHPGCLLHLGGPEHRTVHCPCRHIVLIIGAQPGGIGKFGELGGDAGSGRSGRREPVDARQARSGGSGPGGAVGGEALRTTRGSSQPGPDELVSYSRGEAVAGGVKAGVGYRAQQRARRYARRRQPGGAVGADQVHQQSVRPGIQFTWRGKPAFRPPCRGATARDQHLRGRCGCGRILDFS